MFIVDAHEDIAYNALHNDRDVRRSVRRTRELESARVSSNCCFVKGMDETAMVGLPDLKRGGTGLVFATIFAEPADSDAMHEDALAQIAYYQQLAENDTGVRLITDAGHVRHLLADWHAAPSPEKRPVGFILLMEGADPIREPDELEAFVSRGLRIVGPAWHGTRYAGGTGSPGPLTARGRQLLAEMHRLGVLLDLSHLAEEAFWQALEQFPGPVLASHSNSRIYVPTDRQLSDAMIQAIATRGGVIGTVLCNPFLLHGWKHGDPPAGTDAVVRMIDHVCQLTGSVRHVGIGSDFDGGFGVESTPDGLDSVADLETIAGMLEQHGYSEADIARIMGDNWLALLSCGLPQVSAEPLVDQLRT